MTSAHALGNLRPSRMKPKRLRILFNFQHLKSRCFETITKSIGNNRHKRVAYMNQAHKQALQAVGTGKNPARLQDAPGFAENLVLKSGSVHVVEHCETNAAGELFACEWHLGSVAFDDPNIAAVQAASERLGQLAVNFNRREVRHSLAQEVGGQAGARTQFKHVRS